MSSSAHIICEALACTDSRVETTDLIELKDQSKSNLTYRVDKFSLNDNLLTIMRVKDLNDNGMIEKDKNPISQANTINMNLRLNGFHDFDNEIAAIDSYYIAMKEFENYRGHSISSLNNEIEDIV